MKTLLSGFIHVQENTEASLVAS